MRNITIHFTLILIVVGAVAAGLLAQSPPVTEFCNLVKSPSDFDGKVVTVKAAFRYGFEWQEIFCLSCRHLSKTWMEIEDDLISPKSRKALKKLPKNGGTVSAVFTGKFESTGKPFGDGSYSFKFTLTEFAQSKVVSKSGFDPSSLPENIRKGLCSHP